MLQRYQRAEQFLSKNITKLTKNISVDPNWVKDSDDFWFKEETEKGYKFMYFNAKKKEITEAFDHAKMAEIIGKLIDKNVNPDSLKLNNLTFIERGKIGFQVKKKKLEVNLKDYTISEKEKEEKPAKWQSKSPDGKWTVSVKLYNLYLTNNETGEEVALTDDGIEKYEYATPLSWYKMKDESAGEKYDPSIYVRWSKDSRKFVCSRLDRRKVGKLFLYQSLPDSGMRAKVWSYERALPGEEPIYTEYYSFDVGSKSKVKINFPPFADFTGSIYPAWFKNNKAFYFARFERGYGKLELFKADAETGETNKLFTEESKTMVEYQVVNCHWREDESQFFWTSERDGWCHIYAVDGKTGLVKKQLTKGEFVVHNIVKVDEKKELVYFIAGGKEEGRDPYYKHLYAVDFEGKEVKLFTPENANHSISISPDGNYFTDSYSTISTKPTHVIRSTKNGKVVAELAQSNIDKLLEAGYKMPQPFKVKARDGKTDIYGAMFYPSDFDPSKKYPVIDGTYSGPQAVRTPKSFARAYRAADVSLAELGFIVITIDGLGTAKRSKAFHNFSHKNLGDIGAEDHISGMKQLAETHPYLNLERVGIYGHSAGGYDAAHALLIKPDFYKVAVSSAGNHDHGMAKAWWPEQYMGLPGKHYKEQSNLTLAKNLKGKLLLVHGDMDNNVNPASSLRLAAELIKENKDFELLLIPNRNHGLSGHPYFIRKRWDWFVEHLMGVKPPSEYKIKSYTYK